MDAAFGKAGSSFWADQLWLAFGDKRFEGMGFVGYTDTLDTISFIVHHETMLEFHYIVSPSRSR